MAKQLSGSLLELALSEMANDGGSPYIRVYASLLAGGQMLYPIKTTRFVIESDYSTAYSDVLLVYMVFPKGDLMRKISPFVEDLNIELSVHLLNEDGTFMYDESDPDSSSELFKRMYRAYIDDHIKSPININDDDVVMDEEMSNLDLDIVIFKLEEVAVEQLRLMRCGISNSRMSAPMDVVRSLLVLHANSVELDEDELITGPDVEEGYNTSRSWAVRIPDGTPLLDMPDYVHNEQGGLYSDALGFYVTANHMFLWPLYKVNRIEEAKRVLRVFIAPDKASGIIERTWRTPPYSPDNLEVWSSGEIIYEDESMSIIQKYGNVVSNINPERLVDGVVKSEGNAAVIEKQNVPSSRFSKSTLLSGRKIYGPVQVSSNPYVIASKQARANGAVVTLQWQHSLHWLIVPGMAVEMVYDMNGEIRNVIGTLLSAITVMDNMSDGPVTTKFKSTTTLTLFVDRDDHLLEEWIINGENVITTPVPVVGSI